MKSCLTFLCGGDRWATSLELIREIVQPPAITRVPFADAAIRGVINLRGKILPVIDLAARLHRTAAISSKNCLLIVEMQDGEEIEEVAVSVDGVSMVLDIPDTALHAVPDFGADLRADFLEGVARLEDQIIPILNMKRLLNLEELRPYIYGD